MPTLQKVVLLNVNGVYRARPAYVVVAPGDTVRFLNITGAEVELTFPQGPFTGATTIADGAVANKTVPSPGLPDDALVGRLPYKGRINGMPDLLQGESSPEIIVDRFTDSSEKTGSRPAAQTQQRRAPAVKVETLRQRRPGTPRKPPR